MIEPLLSEPTRHPQQWPYRVALCGTLELKQGFLAWDGTHIISIEGSPGGPSRLSAESDWRLSLAFEDVSDAARPDAPKAAHLDAAMAFVDELPADAALVIHSVPGFSRSTARVLGLFAREVSPARAGCLLHALRPFACPNPLVVKLWDDALELGGELVEVAEQFPTLAWHEPPAAQRGLRHGREL